MTEMRSSGTLGDLLAPCWRRRFVGRASKIKFVRAAFESVEPPCSRVHLRGRGGMGNSSLLDSFAGLAADTSASVTDDRCGKSLPADAVHLLGTLACL
jgi:hypothetical protein